MYKIINERGDFIAGINVCVYNLPRKKGYGYYIFKLAIPGK